MSVPVMMFGGRRDGEILEVPGYLKPDALKVVFTMREKFLSSEDVPMFSSVDKRNIIIDIVPRKAKDGPAWKIELPKELW